MQQYDIFALAPGTEEKFIEAEAAIQAKIQTTPVGEFQAMSAAEDEEEQSRLLQIADTVGIVSIKGGLTNSNSYFNQWFGLVAYDEVRAAMLEAMDAGVGAILLDIDSPGGRVSGMDDVAEFISSVNIPVISFTSGSMASAAFFLGVQADHVYSTEFAEVGSVGVVVKTYDRSERLKEMGIKPIRFRSGKLKAVGDGDFKMTAEEKTYIQSKVDTFAGKFFAIVSEARGLPLPVMEKLGITTGRTFIGEEAVKAQLADENKTFDESMMKAYALAKKVVDKRQTVGLVY